MESNPLMNQYDTFDLHIHIGTHQGLSNEIESLQSKKRKKLILADLLRKYQFQSISSFYDFEKKQAEDEFNV